VQNSQPDSKQIINSSTTLLLKPKVDKKITEAIKIQQEEDLIFDK